MTNENRRYEEGYLQALIDTQITYGMKRTAVDKADIPQKVLYDELIEALEDLIETKRKRLSEDTLP